MKTARLPLVIVMVMVAVLSVACTTANLETLQPVVAPIHSVSIEAAGLDSRQEAYFEKLVIKRLPSANVRVSTERTEFAPHARGEFDNYYRGNGFLRVVTGKILGRPALDVTWTILAPETEEVLAVCRVDAWAGWGQIDILSSGLKRVILYTADRLADCLRGKQP